MDQSIKGASSAAEQEFAIQYPAVYNHLLNFKPQLLQRNKAETGIRYEWYALQRWGSNYWEDFYKQKIIWKRVGSLLRFSFDDAGCFALDSTCFSTGKHLKYLVGILNSKIGKYILKNAPQTGTGDLLISVQAIEPLKIPIPDIIVEQRFNTLVDSILETCGNNDFVKEIENELDKMSYRIYDFNEEEIEFIEYQ